MDRAGKGKGKGVGEARMDGVTVGEGGWGD